MLLSVTGHISSGKDTIADYLVDKHNFTQMSFAGPVKDVVASIFGWDRDMLEGKTKEHREARNVVDKWWSKELNIENFTPRLALTTIGTDVLRNHFNDDIWVSCLKKKIQSQSSGNKIIISDARYINELNMLRKLGFMSIVVERGEKPSWYNSALKYNKSSKNKKKFIKYLSYIKKLESDIYSFIYQLPIPPEPDIFNCNIHSSEYDWIGYRFDYNVFNNDTIEVLYSEIDYIIQTENNLLNLFNDDNNISLNHSDIFPIEQIG